MDHRSVAQPGSASDWGSEGRGFESRHSDHLGHKNPSCCNAWKPWDHRHLMSMINRFLRPRWLLALLMAALASNAAQAQDAVLSWKSQITIRSDAVLDVVEQVQVRAESEELRIGLLRPFALEDNRDATISLIEVRRDGLVEAATLQKDGLVRILRLGNEAAPLLPGEHLYVIHYTVAGAVSFENDVDRLRWFLTPRDFSLPIEDAQAQIFLPNGMKITRQQTTIATRGVRANDFITQSREGQLSIDVMRPLKPGEALLADISWPKNVVQRPSSLELAKKRVRGQLHVVAGALGLLLLYILSKLLQFLASRGARTSSGDALGPAMSRMVRLGRVDDTSVVATIIGMATKGYLTIERTETDTYLLQRTWKEGDLGLIPTDRAIAVALYQDKPSRFFIIRENMESLRAAQFELRRALQTEIETVLMRRARPWLLVMLLGALLVIGGIIHLAPVAETVWLPTLLLLAGQIMAYRGLCLRPSALRWQIGQEQRGWLATLGDVLTTRSCLPGLGLSLLGFIWLLLLIKLPSTLLILLIGGIFVLTIHRMRSLARLGGKLVAAVAESEDVMFDSDATFDPQRFERDLPLAIALEDEAAWSRPFAATLGDGGVHMGYRPRWYSGLRGTFVADQFAPQLAADLRQAIERAIG